MTFPGNNTIWYALVYGKIQYGDKNYGQNYSQIGKHNKINKKSQNQLKNHFFMLYQSGNTGKNNKKFNKNLIKINPYRIFWKWEHSRTT